MSTELFDAAHYKVEQRRSWNAVAAGWMNRWARMEPPAQPVSDRLLALAHVEPGQRVLDVASGIGEPAMTAARRVGPSGRVVATDQAARMLAIARQRATAEGLRNIEFLEMDAETLALPAASFNAVLCRWGLMFFPNLGEVLADMRRLLVAGGCFAAATWGEASKVPHIGLPMLTLRRTLQLPPPQPGLPGPFSLADAGALEQALTDAGFTEVRSERLNVAFAWDSAEDYTRHTQEVQAPLGELVARESSQRRASFWQALTESAGAYAAADGRVRLPAEAICFAARR